MGDWIVVLEFSAFRGDRPFELGLVQAVVERLREWHPSGLFNPDRYAVQLHVPAECADEALRMATGYHQAAIQAEGAHAALSRAEVLTLGEFESSWSQGSGSTAGAVRPGAAQALISIEVYEATRALLSASTPAEVTDILVRFVLAVGGQVKVGNLCPRPEMVAVDLGVATGQPLHAVAEALSVAGLILERWLPPLLDDAQRTLERLDRSP